ncbi:MAG: T9SS type A sorting domain-containing protein [Vicingaceae bacterium]
MKKNYFLLALLTLTTAAFAQKTIIVNGGQFGNQNENANVMIYDTQTKSSQVIDTIHTQSVQDILIDGNFAFVAAQDSIVKYNLNQGTRVASAAFSGVSTKTFTLSGNELLVGNWYAQTTDNLYIYDKNNLNLIDSVTAVEKGAISILVDNGFAYISQNETSANFTDTLGYIIKVDLANRTVVDTAAVSGYTQDMGELILRPDGNGFYVLNSGSNTITSVDFASFNATNTSLSNNLRVGGKSHISIQTDTLFARMDNGIGAIDLTNLSVFATNIVDTVVSAFTYDTLNKQFYVTQTDFFSYNLGKIYDRAGNKLDTMPVGYAPEVIRMYYDQSVGLHDFKKPAEFGLTLFPNPSSEMVNINFDQGDFTQLRLLDLKGKVLLEKGISTSRALLDVSNFSKGMYLIELSNATHQTAKPLIIK